MTAFSPYFDPEYDSLSERINGPSCRVTFNNESLEDYTIVKIDCVQKQDQLLKVVQVLTEVNLTILKGYISSDAGWFMDVFHVKENGKKISDQRVINYIQKAIGSNRRDSSKITTQMSKLYDTDVRGELTAIEMTAMDRPGLFSEISAALADLQCNVVEAHSWSHNSRLACVVYISDHSSDTHIDDHRLAAIKHHLNTILNASNTLESTSLEFQQHKNVKSIGLIGAGGNEGTMTTVERRLHQLLLSAQDFDVPPAQQHARPPGISRGMVFDGEKEVENTSVLIENCSEKGYSIVTVQCKDRRRLMFDTVCTLTDMQYVISHASVDSHGGYAFQEYFVRKIDGGALSSESEKQHAMKCLEAAVKRRVCEGTRLELSATNRVGLLSDITRVLRERGLVVLRVDLATKMDKCRVDITLYLRDVFEDNVDMELVTSMKREMGVINLAVKNEEAVKPSCVVKPRFSVGDIFKSQMERLSHIVL